MITYQLMTKKKNTSVLKLNKKIEQIKFKDYYYNHYDYMRIISLDRLKKIL